ncbi:four helix bundle protein [Candidatus Falkowbacteria bacterium]|nr:four helix bundle protein [Candidatus Falkowbacteria bacterium]
MVEDSRNLKKRADKLLHMFYDLTMAFPKEELYVLTAQIRRAILSVPVNIVEGYARVSSKTFLYHLGVAYGSLAEAKYFLNFACRRGYITNEQYLEVWQESEEVSKMLWKSIETMKRKVDNVN